MKCSNCGNEMITSRTGWLCVSCGHAELARQSDEALPQIIRERPRGRIDDPIGQTDDPNKPRVHTAPAPAGETAPAPAAAPAAAAAVTAAEPVVSAAPAQPVAPAPVEAAASTAPATEPAPAVEAAPVAPAPATVTAEPEAENKGLDAVISEISAAVAAQSNVQAVPAPAPATPAPAAPTPAAALHPSAPVVSARLVPAPAPVAAPDAAPVELVPAPAPVDVTPAAAPPAVPAPVPTPTPVPVPEPAPAAAPAPAPVSDALPPADPADLMPHTALSSSPAVATALAGTVTPPPAPAAERKPVLDILKIKKPEKPADAVKPAEPSFEPEATPAPKPEPVKPAPGVMSEAVAAAKPLWDAAPTSPEPKPQAQPPAASAPANTPISPKSPVQPVTHPKKMSLPRHALSWAAIALGILILMVIAFAIGSGQSPLQLFRQTSSATPAPTVAVITEPSSAEVLAATTTYDPLDADGQRRQDIAAYAAAYMPLQKKGYYPVKPPLIKLSLTDPATHQPYRITVNPPAAVGDLQYWLGGSCDGTPQKPARAGAKTLALRLFLETSSTPACIQIR